MSHYVKLVLDEIFGNRRFINEIIWTYKYGSRGRRTFGRKHDVILAYGKTAGYFLDIDAVRIPHEDASLEQNFRHVDDDGRRYRQGRWSNGKTYRYYADEGRAPDDVWADLNAIHQASGERLG